MDGIDFKEVFEKFCYVSEHKSFYNKNTKRKLKEASIRKQITEIYPSLSNKGAIVDDIVQDLRQFSYTPVQLAGERVSRGDVVSAIYEEISDSIPLRWMATVSGEDRLYHVNENREVTYSGETSFANFLKVIRGSETYLENLNNVFNTSEICKQFRESSRTFNFESYIKLVYDQFKFDPQYKIVKEPPIITHDKVELAYKRFNAELLESGDTPAWDEFLQRVNYPEIFMAWVWSIFEPKNKGRQVMWLQGKGNDGKSSIIQAITDYLGKDHTMPIEENTNSQFFYSNVYGKRLASFGDCKSPRYIANSKIHSLVGGDYVPIERKGEQPFTAFVRVKLIIASNYFPQIDFSMPNEFTRLILLKVVQPESLDGDINFEECLREEKWKFLYRCREMYAKYCKNHVQIKCPDELFEEMRNDASSEESNFVTEFVDSFLDFADSDYKVKLNDMYYKLEEVARARGFNNTKIPRLKRDLERRLEDEEVEKKRMRFGKKKNGKSDIVLGFKGVKIVNGDDYE